MATALLSNDDFHTNVEKKHLEIFHLIWFDANVNIIETRDTEQKLRSVINHLKKFQDVKQCQQYIEQRSKSDRLVLIVSGRLGQEIVSSIHKLRQVTAIYVHCIDKESNEQWASKFAKVKLFQKILIPFYHFFYRSKVFLLILLSLSLKLQQIIKFKKR